MIVLYYQPTKMKKAADNKEKKKEVEELRSKLAGLAAANSES